MKQGRVFRPCTTRDGRPYVVREAELTDATLLIQHTQAMLREPQWSITEAHEFRLTLDEEERWILSFGQRNHSLLLVADFGSHDRPVVGGMLSFWVQPRRRLRHRGRVGLGVQAQYRGVGVGETLLRTLLNWAEAEPEVERVELSVFAHNTRAISLYRKVGFVEEARLLRSYKLDDESYYDDVMMVRWVK
jgi:RimJ/RimL family protein N-acetyltransferase